MRACDYVASNRQTDIARKCFVRIEKTENEERNPAPMC